LCGCWLAGWRAVSTRGSVTRATSLVTYIHSDRPTACHILVAVARRRRQHAAKVVFVQLSSRIYPAENLNATHGTSPPSAADADTTAAVAVVVVAEEGISSEEEVSGCNLWSLAAGVTVILRAPGIPSSS